MNKKLFITLGISLFIMGSALNTTVSLNSQKKPGLSFSNALALANGENGNGENGNGENGDGQNGGQKVMSITQTDAGRETIYVNESVADCRKRTITCKGTGTLDCPMYTIAYDDCRPVS
jgi:hypothetical protein